MLEFNSQISTPETGPLITGLDPEGFQEQMVRDGHFFFDVTWEGYVARLFIEDDVMFLCDAYQELISFIEKGGEHSVFLGDGELHMETTREGDVVHVVCTNVPGLHRAFLKKKEYTASLHAYVGAWTRFMRALIELAKSPPPPEVPNL
jgi:hypothetical protein